MDGFQCVGVESDQVTCEHLLVTGTFLSLFFGLDSDAAAAGSVLLFDDWNFAVLFWLGWRFVFYEDFSVENEHLRIEAL